MQLHSSTIPLTRRLLLWASICATVTLAACSTMTPANPEDQVKLRANARWKYMVAKEFDKAYPYSTPAFRQVVSPDSFRGRFGPAVVWVSAEVASVKCPEPEKCIANIRLEYTPLMMRSKGAVFNTYFEETWLLEDGQWWIFQNLKGE